MKFHKTTYLFNRLAKKNVDISIRNLAQSSVKLSESENIYCRPAIVLPGMLSRARLTSQNATLEQQLEIANGGNVTHPGPVLFRIGDTCIDRTGIYSNGMRWGLDRFNLKDYFVDSVNFTKNIVSDAVLITSSHGFFYFGDWLFENNSRAYLATRLGLNPIEIDRFEPYPTAKLYRSLFETKTSTFRRARINNLFYLYDIGHTNDKRQRYHKLRAKIRSKVSGINKGHTVFVARGNSGRGRNLENESECINWAVSRGYRVVYPHLQSLYEVLSELKDASVIIGVEGSGLLNAATVCSSDAIFLAIAHADRFIISSKNYIDALDMRFALVVVEQGSPDKFSVSIKELDETYNVAVNRSL